MMLTRCPECATVFRVTPDQLKARQGRVRCGRCQRVFNAIDALIDNVPAHLVSPPVVEPGMSAAEVDRVPELFQPTSAATSFGPIAEPDPEPIPDDVAPENAVLDQGPLTTTEPQDAADLSSAEEPAPPKQSPSEPLVAVSETATSTTDAAEIAGASGRADIMAVTVEQAPSAILQGQELGGPEPGYDESLDAKLPAAEAPASEKPAKESPALEPLLHEPPRQPPMWPWAVATVFFAALLAAQTALFYRVELAIQYPQLLPSFASICEQIGCEMPLPRRSELVSIEASDLNPDTPRKGRLRLFATLKNRADFAQDYPHLELTLTDTQDQPLVRRALSPTEYLTSTPPATGFAARGETAVALSIDASSVPASGYRLYVFYP